MHTMKCYLATKEKEILSYVTTWMDLKDVSKVRQKQKDKYCIISCTYGL